MLMTLGHLYCSLALFLTSLITELFSSVVRWLVSVVSSVTGIQKNSPKVGVVQPHDISLLILQPWIQMYSTEPVLSEENILDESLMLSKSDFPIKSADLVQKCKVWYYSNLQYQI